MQQFLNTDKQRQNDLIVLTAASFIGTLADPNNPATVNGVGVPLANQWVLTAKEQAKVKTATDAYNTRLKQLQVQIQI